MMDNQIENWVREINAGRDSQLPDRLIPPASRLHAMHGRLPTRRRSTQMRVGAVAACVMAIAAAVATRQWSTVDGRLQAVRETDASSGMATPHELQNRSGSIPVELRTIDLPDGLSLRVAAIDFAMLDVGLLADRRASSGRGIDERGAFGIDLAASDLLLDPAVDLSR